MTDLAMVRRGTLTLLAALLLSGLAGCGSDETKYPRSADGKGGSTYEDRQSVFGGGGLNLFGGEKGPLEAQENGTSGIGVNSFLWRASLDTIAFMPLASADPFGGVIITDWYSPPESASERFKVNVYILGRDLRADGIRAAVFRQQSDTGGQWIDAKVEGQTVVELENAILTRARQLRIAGVQ